jgi:hypothetical protein
MRNAKAKFRSRLSTMVPQRLLAGANESDDEWFLKSGVGRFENLSCFADGVADPLCPTFKSTVAGYPSKCDSFGMYRYPGTTCSGCKFVAPRAVQPYSAHVRWSEPEIPVSKSRKESVKRRSYES